MKGVWKIEAGLVIISNELDTHGFVVNERRKQRIVTEKRNEEIKLFTSNDFLIDIKMWS